MKKLNLSSFKSILCDSNSALNWAFDNELSENIIIKSSSPHLIISAKRSINYLEKYWNINKMKDFSKNINPTCINIFNILIKEKRIDKEEALLSSIVMLKFHQVIYKAACLNDKDIKLKTLFLKVRGNFGRKKININTEWENIFKNKKNFFVINTPEIKTQKNEMNLFQKIKIFIYRIQVAGVAGVLLNPLKKIISIFFKYKKKRVYVLGYNELISETVYFFLLRLFKIIDVNFSLDKKESKNNNFYVIRKKITPIINKSLKKNINKNFVKACEDFFFKELSKELDNYEFFKNKTLKFLNKKENKYSILLTSNHTVSKSLGIIHSFKKNKIPVISFQHGITSELSSISDQLSSIHNANNADFFMTFNKISAKVSKKQAYIKSKPVVVGLPKKYIRAARKNKLLFEKSRKVLFLSMNLYRGNISNFNDYLTDLNKSKLEISIVENVLSKIPYKVDYKPYLTENLRYPDHDPVLDKIKSFKNISLLNLNVDARFILSKYNLFIVQGASSTLSWIILTNKPIVYIENKYKMPLSNSAKKEMKKSVLYFDYYSKNFNKDILELLSKSLYDIRKLYDFKKKARKEMIENYFGSITNNAGKNVSNFILNKYFKK